MKFTDGVISRFAGTGEPGYAGDYGMASGALLNGPAGLAIDRFNNVYIAEIHNHVIRKVNVGTGIITTFAGCGEKGFSGDGGPAVSARLCGPEGVYADGEDHIYIADTYNHRIRKVDAKTGIISTIAGTGEAGYNGDNNPAIQSKLHLPSGVVADSKGNVYFNDYKNDRVRKVDLSGIITTYVGTGIWGYSGDGGPASSAQINDVYGLAIDKYDNLYLMDSLNFAVRKIDGATGIITTVIGKGRPGPLVENCAAWDCYLGKEAHEKGTIGAEAPHAIDVDRHGNLFIGDTGLFRIRMMDCENGTVYTVAGNGCTGCAGDDAIALDACIGVHGLRVSNGGDLFFVDYHHHVVRLVRFR